MSEETLTDSVPCPSCGGTVRIAATGDESEWTICPHCKHEWACQPPRREPGPPPGRRRRLARSALFLAGLLISTVGVASVFQTIEYPEGGGILVRRVGLLALTFAVACYLAPRPWRWGGFALSLASAAYWGEGRFFVGCVATLVGMLLREPTEWSALNEPPDPDDRAGRNGDRAAQRRSRERRQIGRRRTLLLLSAYVLLLVPFSLGGCYLIDRRVTEVRRERQQAQKREFDRIPDTPDYLVALHRTPHEGARAYDDFVRELEQRGDLDYRGRAFRVVGKATSLRQLSPPGLSFAGVEIKMRDRDGTGATFDTAYFVFHVDVAHTTPRIRRNVKFGESDGDLVVIDGFLDERHRFTNCVMRWHGDGNDWEAAVTEAKKGLDLSKINRKRAPDGD